MQVGGYLAAKEGTSGLPAREVKEPSTQRSREPVHTCALSMPQPEDRVSPLSISAVVQRRAPMLVHSAWARGKGIVFG